MARRNRTEPAVPGTCSAPIADDASRADLDGHRFRVALESNARAAAMPRIVRTKLINLAIRSVSEIASMVGAVGVSTSAAVLVEGVVGVLRIKTLAITAVGLVALGTLGLVIANRAAAVGGSTYQKSVPRGDAPSVRQAGADGKAIGSPKAIPQAQYVTQTYYVGDILGTDQRLGARLSPVSVPGHPATALQHFVDMKPLTAIIAATVAPGTWLTDELDANAMTSERNVMVPF
jgi:hypothetical protein